jgi:hypothetical protein
VKTVALWVVARADLRADETAVLLVGCLVVVTVVLKAVLTADGKVACLAAWMAWQTVECWEQLKAGLTVGNLDNLKADNWAVQRVAHWVARKGSQWAAWTVVLWVAQTVGQSAK